MTDTTDTRPMSDRIPTLRRLGPGDLIDPPACLTRNWGWLLALGIVLVLGGIAAIAAPFLASIAVEGAVGAMMLIGGVLQGVHVWRAGGWRARLWSGVLAAVYLAGGGLLFLNPLAGLVALTLVLLSVLLVDGIARIVFGLRLRPERGWGWMTASGAVSTGLAAVLFLLFPAISLTALGTLAGVALIFEGWSFLFLALAARAGRDGETAA